MDDIYSAALCSYYNVPLNYFLQLYSAPREHLWEFLQVRQRWSLEQLQDHLRIFEHQFQRIDPEDVICWGHVDYPKGFERLHSPPLFLHYHGNRQILKRQNIAVIGSRQMAPSFARWMDHEFGLFLNQFKGAVVSGGARGVDLQASRVALRHHHETLIIVPSGLDVLYPALLKDWWNHPHVAFLTEYFPRQPMHKHHFLKRNRLVAALTDHLLVVQCAEKSGTMITVKYALDIAIQIGTIPDFPGLYESSGNLKLLKDGAFFIAHHRDLLDFVGMP